MFEWTDDITQVTLGGFVRCENTLWSQLVDTCAAKEPLMLLVCVFLLDSFVGLKKGQRSLPFGRYHFLGILACQLRWCRRFWPSAWWRWSRDSGGERGRTLMFMNHIDYSLICLLAAHHVLRIKKKSIMLLEEPSSQHLTVTPLYLAQCSDPTDCVHG